MNAPLRILIVDDEPPARLRLRNLLDDLQSTQPNQVIGEASNGQQALEILSTVAADVALIDIRMPVMDGIQLALQLRTSHPGIAIIFATAFDQFAVKAFELSATDYLLKPITVDRLHAALAKAPRQAFPFNALEALAPEGRLHLRSTERGRVTLIPVREILYLRADSKYVTAKTLTTEYLIDDSLAQLEKEFGDRFVRTHRSCLVAKDAICGYEKERSVTSSDEARWMLILKGSAERLPVSRRQWHHIKELISAV